MRNRILPLFSVLVCLCLLLTAAAGGEEDAADQTGLIIQDASYDASSGRLTITWTNTGSGSAAWAELRILPRDAEGKQVVIGTGAPEEMLDELRVRHVTVPAAPGEMVSATVTVGHAYPAAASLEIAFDRVVWEERTALEDGSTEITRMALDLPEQRLHWYSTAQNAYVSNPAGGLYTMPAEEILKTAEENRLGLTVFAVSEELAGAYGYGWSGLLVLETEEGSAAGALGFEPGDLIFGADGKLYGEEPYILPLAVNTLAGGGTVTFLVERDGEAMAIECGPAEE